MLDSNDLTLWLITGEASTGSGGGHHKVYVLTGSRGALPNVDLALDNAYPGAAWYDIESVTQVANDVVVATDSYYGHGTIHDAISEIVNAKPGQSS